jgi:hypothetical protein
MGDNLTAFDIENDELLIEVGQEGVGQPTRQGRPIPQDDPSRTRSVAWG